MEEDAGLKTPPKKARVTIPLSASTIPAPFGVPYAQDSAGATLNGTPQDADEKIAVKAELIDWATATLAALQPAVAKPDLSRPSSTKVETEADAFRAWTTLEDDPDDDELAASLDVKDNVF